MIKTLSICISKNLSVPKYKINSKPTQGSLKINI